MRVAGGLFALLALVYGPHIARASLVYEDAQLVASAGPLAWQGRGLTRASWAWVSTPQASHALNLALHLVVVGFVWVISRRLVEPWIAFGLAGLMALHPLTVETVAYAASRSELIAAVGVLGALACVTARSAWWWLCVPCCLVVVYMGKESGLVGLGLIPLVLWARRERLWAELVTWGVVAAVVVIVAVDGPSLVRLGETARMQVDPIAWGLMQAEAVWRLLVLSVAPFWLSVVPNITTPRLASVAAVILLAGLLEAAWRARAVAPLFTFGVVWCALVAAPRFLVRTPFSPFNEHQFYLALPGVACCVMAGLEAMATQIDAWRSPCRA